MSSLKACVYCDGKLPSGHVTLRTYTYAGETPMHACRDLGPCSDRMQQRGLGRRDFSAEELGGMQDTLRAIARKA